MNNRNETGTSVCDRNVKDYSETVYNKNNSMPANQATLMQWRRA